MRKQIIDIDYVGFLLSNCNADGHIDRNTTSTLHNQKIGLNQTTDLRVWPFLCTHP